MIFNLKYSCLSIVVFMSIVCSSIVNAQERHSLLTDILKEHVREGLVNYNKLCKDERLNLYRQQISVTDPTLLLRNEGMAFWINSYNFFTLDLICQNYPIKSINQLHTGGLILGSIIKKTAWDKPFISIHNNIYSLGQIEHKILRPQYKDPRIHFAIVCAARSCPPLRSEAYEGFKLNDQLNDQGRVFLTNRSDLNSYDVNTRTAHISAIFNWFFKDFGGSENKLLDFISQYVPDGISSDISEYSKRWKIKYKKYDWSLNEQ